MFEISFRNESDATAIYMNVLEKNPESDSILSLHKEKIVVESKDVHFYRNTIVPVLKYYIHRTKEKEWILSVLENTFYYKEEEEQEQILCILQSILLGERSDIPNLPAIEQRDAQLESVMQSFFQKPISFSFDSFITFRLKEYFEGLQVFVEAAIDEYKLEQEYQSFVHQLRELLTTTDSKLDELHLVYQYQFDFYDKSFSHIPKNQLIKFMNRTHFNNYSYYIDSVVLAPLVSIAPKKLFLYTDNTEHQLVETIRNIFEERAVVLPFHYFGQNKSKID
ncbi:MAG: sporulation protein YtxC [Bacillota bacterium]|uniref:sporulation protein YtxC n=1 Tax=Bacillus sp. RO2 TaxID=2723913 RepID=UPI00145D6CC9|nr:sporulation protein YtxC [Bacillus sp. RO2]MEA3320926.1 sporulation protein YtxC [Bacillota bacterium]NMH71516.1 putative sporulation protein YtxC [Bacillus sp. RO2]